MRKGIGAVKTMVYPLFAEPYGCLRNSTPEITEAATPDVAELFATKQEGNVLHQQAPVLMEPCPYWSWPPAGPSNGNKSSGSRICSTRGGGNLGYIEISGAPGVKGLPTGGSLTYTSFLNLPVSLLHHSLTAVGPNYPPFLITTRPRPHC